MDGVLSVQCCLSLVFCSIGVFAFQSGSFFLCALSGADTATTWTAMDIIGVVAACLAFLVACFLAIYFCQKRLEKYRRRLLSSTSTSATSSKNNTPEQTTRSIL